MMTAAPSTPQPGTASSDGANLSKQLAEPGLQTFRQLMRWCEQWPERRFAVEGAGGLGTVPRGSSPTRTLRPPDPQGAFTITGRDARP